MGGRYPKPTSRAFGKAGAPSTPLKRPSRSRSRFTVQAIHDGLVRIAGRKGWDAVTIRSLAIETGYAVGTIYDCFPDREAVLSVYVRHQMQMRYNGIDAPAERQRHRVQVARRAEAGENDQTAPPP